MAIKTVIDTNILVSSLSSRSEYHWLIQLILQERIDLFVTTEILMEYEEVLKQKYSEVVAESFMIALKELPNVHFVQVYFNWNLLKDPDDNKFVDCYLAANAEFLVTNDSGFNNIKLNPFPAIKILSIGEFKNVQV